jgi:hypothetical protein
MSAIDDKLRLLRRAHNEIQAARAAPDREGFEYAFCAFIGFAGAIRQYLQRDLKTPLKAQNDNDEQRWLQALEDDPDVATVLALRNVDVHDISVKSTRATVKASFGSGLTFETELKSDPEPRKTTGEVFETSEVPMTSSPSPRLPPEIRVLYDLDAKTLPKDFMRGRQRPWPCPRHGCCRRNGRLWSTHTCLKANAFLPMKAIVLAQLTNHDLGAIADRAYQKIVADIAYARNRGFF